MRNLSAHKDLLHLVAKRWLHFFQIKLWEELAGGSRWRELCIIPLRVAVLVWEGRRRHLILLRASALTYVTAISIVPTLAFIFALAKGFGVHHFLEPFLLKYIAFGQEEIIRRIIQYISNTNVKALGSIGFLLVLVSVIGAMGTIERTFNQIWGVQQHRRGFRKVADYLSILAIFPLAVMFSVAMTAAVSSSTIAQKLRLIGPFSQVMDWLFTLGPYVMLWVGFIFLYILAPNTRVRTQSAVIGGFLAGTVWQASLCIYTQFQIGLARYNAIYSGFASLPFFLVWLYVSWVIVLFGAEIVFIHQNLRSFKGTQLLPDASPRYRERLALRAMMKIAHRFYTGGSPWEAAELSRALQVHPALLAEVLSTLQGNKLIVELLGDGRRFIPARDLEKIFVIDVVTAVYRGKQDFPEQMNQVEEAVFRDILAPARQSMEDTLGAIHFQQLCQSMDKERLSTG